MKPYDIKERTFEFANRIIDLVEEMPQTRTFDVLARQLIRAGTSVGANVEEAHAADSKADFAFKLSIALREARETRYWLRIAMRRRQEVIGHLQDLINEAEEIMKILGSIISKVRSRSS